MLYFFWKRLFGSSSERSDTTLFDYQKMFDRVDAEEPTEMELADATEYFDEGNRQLADSHWSDAERHFRSAIAIHCGFAAAHCNLGSLLKDRGDLLAAEQHLKIALHSNPQLAPALFNLALLYIDARRWTDAAHLLRRTLALDKRQADAQYWLGNAELGLGNTVVAQEAYATAVRIDPQHVQARWSAVMATIPALPETTVEQDSSPSNFQIELEKLRRWFEAHKSSDDYKAVGATQPFYLAYIENNYRATLAEYGNLCTNLMSRWSHQTDLPPPAERSGKKYRVGIVSTHIHSHSVWRAIVKGWLAHLDPNIFEIHLFYTGAIFDSETEWASRRVAKFHHTRGTWMEWAKLISESKVDALIYPEIGMDAATTRLASLRLARVQLASWGHPITTGLSTVDYFITSQAMEPLGYQNHYTEKVLPLSRLGSCYQPLGTKAQQPDITQWGIEPEDRILLCAGTPFKYRPEHDFVWVKIAQQCQPCKLVFFKDGQGELSQHLEQRLRKVFMTAGVDFDASVRFIPWQSQAVFFGLLDLAVVYLDSLGFSGFNTTMQAIERNTPVVAYEGRFMRGRFASGILQQLGMGELVANHPDQFIQLAVRVVHDESFRRSIKKKIRINKGLLYSDSQPAQELGRHLAHLCA